MSSAADPQTVTRLRNVFRRVARGLNASTPNVDLTPTKISILGSIVDREPIRVAEIAAVEGLNATMVSRLVGQLAGDGLVKRRSDTTDNRAINVTSTAQGRRVLARVRTSRSDAVAEAFASLSKEEADALRAALPALEQFAGSIHTAFAGSGQVAA